MWGRLVAQVTFQPQKHSPGAALFVEQSPDVQDSVAFMVCLHHLQSGLRDHWCQTTDQLLHVFIGRVLPCTHSVNPQPRREANLGS